METKKILATENLLLNSNRIPLKPNQNYVVTTKVICKNGEPRSAYFFVALKNAFNEEIIRYKSWITNFSNEWKDYTIIFTTPPNVKYALLGYRVNIETPIKGNIEIGMRDLNSLNIEQVNAPTQEAYDSVHFPVAKISSLTSEQEDNIERNIVWILCTPRSGSSWLGMNLLLHQDNIIWNEPLLGDHFFVKGREKNRPDYIFSNHYKSRWLPALKKFIIYCCYIQETTIQKNIIIKEPNGSQSADLISECFPNSKFLFLLRDGRDVVDSYIDAHKPNSWNPDLNKIPLTTQEIRNEYIKKYSLSWIIINEIIEKAYNAHNPKLRLLVKYENLRKNTFEELKKIYKFLEIDIHDNELKGIVDEYSFENIPDKLKGLGKHKRSGLVGGWKNNFNQAEKELMNSIMEKTLTQMGYEI